MYIYHHARGTVASDNQISGTYGPVTTLLGRIIALCSCINIGFFNAQLKLPRLAGGLKGSTYAALHLPSILRHQYWRVILSQLSFSSLSEVFLAYAIIQWLKFYETSKSRRQFVSFVAYLIVIGAAMQMLFLSLVRKHYIHFTSLTPGAYALLFGLITSYFLTLRRRRLYSPLTGFLPISDKMIASLFCVVLLIDGGYSGLLSALTGSVASLMWPSVSRMLGRLPSMFRLPAICLGPKTPIAMTNCPPGSATDFIMAAELAAAISEAMPSEGLLPSGVIHLRAPSSSPGTHYSGLPPIKNDFSIAWYMYGRGPSFARKLLAMADVLLDRFEAEARGDLEHAKNPNIFEAKDPASEALVASRTMLAAQALLETNQMVLASIRRMRMDPTYNSG